MNTKIISSVHFLETQPLLDLAFVGEPGNHDLAVSNTQAVRDYFASLSTELELPLMMADFGPGELIVQTGKIVNSLIAFDADCSYAEVPLGLILEGDVIVTKGGKETKHLSEGDFIGLFETSDWLLTGKKREIGDWTLKTNSPTKILFFSAKTLREESAAGNNFRDYLTSIARADRVPQPTTGMPLLDWVASHTTKSRIPDFAIVVHTHLLPNSLPFFRHLAYLTNFGNIYILEKPYSTVPQTFKDLVQSGCEVIRAKIDPEMPYEFSIKKSTDILWAKIVEDQKAKGFKKILVIDDGGDLWHSIPWQNLKNVSIAGVEQTQRGISRITGSQAEVPPVISVASSGIKKSIESGFIGQSVVHKLSEFQLLPSGVKVGILGMGSIGMAAASSLNDLGCKVSYYDPDPSALCETAERSASLDDLLNKTDLIIGTTGKDSLKGTAFDRVSGDKTFASASSADVEFSSLLKLAEPARDPFGRRIVRVNDKLKIEILNGGYPLNFDRLKNAVPDGDIALTWCLMYTGAMQAVELLKEKKLQPKIYEVDHNTQEKMLERWADENPSAGIAKADIENIVSRANPKLLETKTVWVE